MAVRVQVVVDRLERFRRRAAEEGLSLSAWLREAGREKATARESKRRMTPAALPAFFRKCDARQRPRELATSAEVLQELLHARIFR